MKIQYLGTSAAEGIPAVFCHCKVCDYSRKVRGRNIRTRSQILIDNNLLIDFGPDTYWHSINYGINLADIHYCLITHTHADHFYPEDIKARRKSRANLLVGSPPLTIFGSKDVIDNIHPYSSDHITKDGSVLFQELHLYEKTIIGDHKVTPLPAVHGTTNPFIYITERNKSAFLYGHDSDILHQETLDYIKDRKIKFQCISLDCTEGKKSIDYEGHMNLERFSIMCRMLADIEAIDSSTIKIASHFSHNGLLTYDETVQLTKGQNIMIAYDDSVKK